MLTTHSSSTCYHNISSTPVNMTAISALVAEEVVPRGYTDEITRSPTTPRPTVRILSPGPSNVVTIPSDRRDSTRADVSINVDATTSRELISDTHEPEPGQKNDQKRSSSDALQTSGSADEKDDSDIDIDGDDDESGRKKKSQRFFCTGYPPCNLSFTRSEHLARHIRKHTGERPFQCHCNRRFSRLDNLRQHAQTVHVNEEIPTDSLAATGTRYQRQIRTDRVRPSPRPRTSTMSSSGSHSRGHSRNLSTSSIGSTSSIYSNATDIRRRPPPLLMAGDNRPTTPPTYSSYAAHSPADLVTPTSSTFPVTPSSPNFGSVLGSPVSNNSRTPAFGVNPAGRRLSVPSGTNPYQSPYSQQYGSSYGPGPAVPNHNSSSIVTSPVMSSFSHSSNMSVSSTEDWRRRTWHPSTYQNVNANYNRPATSGLSYSQTPDAPQPAYAHNAMAAAGQAPRLPGIESFDQMQHRPTTPPRRNRSPAPLAHNQLPALMAAPDIDSNRRGHSSRGSWDGSRRSMYPDIDENGRPTTTWGQDTMQQIDQLRDRVQYSPNGPGPVMGPPRNVNMNMQHTQQMAQEALQLQSSASKRIKRSGNYSGTQQTHRTSPEDSSSSDGIPTPGTSTAEIHPTIMHSNGYIEPQLLAGDTQHTVSQSKHLANPKS